MDTTVGATGGFQVTSNRARVDRVAVVHPAAEPAGGDSLRRALVVDGLIGFVLMAGAVYVVGLAVGAGPAGALGIAAFCAFWGGLGFGCMFGAVMHAVREERRGAGGTW